MRSRNNFCCVIILQMGGEFDTGDSKSMPQLDFQEVFSTEKPARTSDVDDSQHLPEYPPLFQQPTRPEKRADRNRTDRLTLLLALVTALGGLSCAMYFFNGADAIWKIFSSPRESFYGRPGEPATKDVQLALLQKNVDPQSGAKQAGSSRGNSAGRPSSSAVSPVSSGPSSSAASAAGTSSVSGVPTGSGVVSGATGTVSGVTSKVGTTLSSTSHRAVATTRKVATRAKKVAKATKKASDTTAKTTAQTTQSSASQAAAATSMRSGMGAGLGSVGRGMSSGLSGSVGGVLGGHR